MFNIKNYNMVDSSGGELSKYILMVEQDITFNNKSARTDENDNTNVFFIKYTSKDNLKYKDSVFINIYIIILMKLKDIHLILISLFRILILNKLFQIY